MSLTHTFAHVAEGIHTSIFSILREEFSLSLQQLGIIAAIPPLCQTVLSIPTGLLTDRYGAKKMIILGFSLAIVGALIASQASNPTIFIVAISLIFINTTMYHPASYSFTTKLFKPRDRSKALGLHGAGGTLGHASGPLAVSILIGILALQWRQVYLIMAVPMALGVVLMLLVRDEPLQDVGLEQEATTEDNGLRSLLTRDFVLFLSFIAMRTIGYSMVSTFLVLYLQDVRNLSLTLASFISSSTMLAGFISAPLGGLLASKYGEKRCLVGTQIIGYTCLAISMVVPNITLFTLLLIAYGFCNTLGMAPRNSMIATLSPSNQRGLGFALLFLPSSIMGAVSPVIAGYLAEAYGFNIIFYSALSVYIIGLAILQFTIKIKRKID